MGWGPHEVTCGAAVGMQDDAGLLIIQWVEGGVCVDKIPSWLHNHQSKNLFSWQMRYGQN